MIKVIRIFSVVVGLYFFGTAMVPAQVVNDKMEDAKIDNVLPVMLGFRVPEEFWSREFTVFENGNYKKKTLEKYRGKPLILDFWATWCTSCVRNFPKLESYKEAYGDHVNFLLVNSFDRDTAKITDIFTNEQYTKYRTNIPSVVLDDYFKQLFPHQAVPIYVWIDDFGRLGAVSTSDFLNDYEIRGMISRVKGAKP